MVSPELKDATTASRYFHFYLYLPRQLYLKSKGLDILKPSQAHNYIAGVNCVCCICLTHLQLSVTQTNFHCFVK